MQNVTGQITFRRAVSRKLVFYDLLLCDAREAGGAQTWLEVVVKLGVYGGVEGVTGLRDRLKLGDAVNVQGCYAGGCELQATCITVVQAWRDSHPGQSFRPLPSPLHAAAPQRRQPQQQPERPKQQRQDHHQQGQQRAQQQEQRQERQQEGRTGSADQLQRGAIPALAAVLEAAVAGGGPVPAAGGVLQPAPAQLGVCKYFVNTGVCAKGDACPFAHLHTGALRQRWLADMRAERRVLSSAAGFAHSGGAAAKRRRAQVFASWLVQTFGRELLSAGEGVLDVAGGAGGITFELAHTHGIRCTLVDPRPLKLNKRQHRQLQAEGRAASIHTLTADQLQLLQQGLPQMQPQPQAQLPGLAADAPAAPAGGWGPAAAASTAGGSTTCGAGPAGGAAASGAAPLACLQVQALFEPQLWRGAGWRQRFGRGFSLVVACHPDQATDPALEYALEEQLPFAIVPCCVFPRLFPHRRLPWPHNGGSSGASAAGPGAGSSPAVGSGSGGGGGSGSGMRPVLSYGDLLEYLTARGQAQQEVLGFEGANVVVYRRQQRQHTEHSSSKGRTGEEEQQRGPVQQRRNAA